MSENVKLKDGFSQVCVWRGVTLGGETPEQFEQYMLNAFKVRVQFLEVINTYPDKDYAGNDVKDTGDRSDLFFAIHSDDIQKFAIPRLRAGITWAGITWVEDVYLNGGGVLYPDRVAAYKTW